MTPLQWIIKEAKSLKKTYPKRFTKWTDYVKQASAIYASKHKGKSPVGKKKAVSKKVAVKKIAKKKVGVIKKKAAKKPSEQSILNKIHKVKHEVERLDEAQHKHMSIGGFDKHIFIKLESVTKEIDQRENVIKSVISRKIDLVHKNGLTWYKNWLKEAKGYVAELKKHKTELKKFI